LPNKQIIKPSQRSFYVKWVVVVDLHISCHLLESHYYPDIVQNDYLYALKTARRMDGRPFSTGVVIRIVVRGGSLF